MKALSVKNPYATRIIYKTKKYEYRTWRTKYRGKLLICSSKSPVIEGMLSGHALGIVELKDVHEITMDNYKKIWVRCSSKWKAVRLGIESCFKSSTVSCKGQTQLF